MGRQSSEYRPLVHDDDEPVPRNLRKPWVKNRALLYTIIIIQAALNLTLLGIGLHFYGQRGPKNPLFPQSLYCTPSHVHAIDSPLTSLCAAPAQDLLKYEVRTFHGGFRPEDKSIYQGEPSKEVDEAWEDLYRCGSGFPAHYLYTHTLALCCADTAISRIPKSDAARLVNKTYPLLGDEDHYVVG